MTDTRSAGARKLAKKLPFVSWDRRGTLACESVPSKNFFHPHIFFPLETVKHRLTRRLQTQTAGTIPASQQIICTLDESPCSTNEFLGSVHEGVIKRSNLDYLMRYWNIFYSVGLASLTGAVPGKLYRCGTAGIGQSVSSHCAVMCDETVQQRRRSEKAWDFGSILGQSAQPSRRILPSHQSLAKLTSVLHWGRWPVCRPSRPIIGPTSD
jgi:hypothetical protein